MINNYLVLRGKHEKDINEFPLFFAFDDKQFKKGLEKLNTIKENIRSLGNGGFIKKEDVKEWQDILIRHSEEHKKAMDDKGYAYNMFRYELSNHEFMITYDLEETLSSLNLTIEEVKKNSFLLEQLEKAKEDYLNEVE